MRARGPKLMAAKFPGKCAACATRFPAGTAILWDSFGARHSTPEACAKATAEVAAAPPAPPAPTMSAAGIAGWLAAAKGRGLKWPKVRFVFEGREMRLTLAGERSKAPGSVNVLVDGEWKGRVEPSGAVVGFRLAENAALMAALAAIEADPEKAAKEYGAMMGSCSFCGLPLTDAGSVEVGYGPVCAKHYGLPHHPKGSPEPKEVAA